RGERRREARVEREPLQRIVHHPDTVEVAPEPAGAEIDVGRADLPVVARAEVALVGVRVADRRHHGDLLLPVEPGEAVCGGMPAEPVVLGERRAARQGEARAELAVERVALRREDGERIGSALEEHAHEDRLPARGCRRGDSLLERADAEELRAAVDGDEGADALRDERPSREAGAGGERHPGLDRGQAAAGLGGGAVQEPRAREAGAAPRHAVCISGLTAISWRSAFCTITGYCLRFHDASAASASAFFANASTALFVCCVRAGWCQN